MNKNELFKYIQQKESFLCIGLEPDMNKFPKHILDQNLEFPLLEFCKEIIDNTAEYAVAYKPNLAFFELFGHEGWLQVELIINYIRHNHPKIQIIADAKRADTYNTSKMYAKAFFERLGADAVTVSPYMGLDSVGPFLEYKDKWTILLNLTNYPGSYDLQTLHIEENGILVYEHMLKKAINEWCAKPDISMFFIDAKKAEYLSDIRKIAPDHFLLIPGVDDQSCSLEEIAKYGLNDKCGLLVNISQSIIYAGDGEDFAEVAGRKAKMMQEKMSQLLYLNKLLKIK